MLSLISSPATISNRHIHHHRFHPFLSLSPPLFSLIPTRPPPSQTLFYNPFPF
ncbi:hypothetical protein LguiA_033072 [Lonicera macranthoides]